jgi:hypothetical protein
VELFVCEKCSNEFDLEFDFHVILEIFYMRHERDGFTSPPKEGVLGIFVALKIPTVFGRV